MLNTAPGSVWPTGRWACDMPPGYQCRSSSGSCSSRPRRSLAHASRAPPFAQVRVAFDHAYQQIVAAEEPDDDGGSLLERCALCASFREFQVLGLGAEAPLPSVRSDERGGRESRLASPPLQSTGVVEQSSKPAVWLLRFCGLCCQSCLRPRRASHKATPGVLAAGKYKVF